MRGDSKTDRRALRELAGLAYERELSEELRDLMSGFSDWQKKQIDAFQLSDLIHGFHDGPARELYKIYTRMKPPELVARAIVRDVISRDEVPARLLASLEPAIARFEEFETDD